MKQARFVSLLVASSIVVGPLAANAQQQPVQPVPIYVNTNPDQPPPPPPVPNSARASNGEYVAPLQQQTQTTYVPQSVALSGPTMIKDWEPGNPIPQGYHPETRTRTGLIVAGAVTFGTLYLISALVAAAGADSSSRVTYSNGQYVKTSGENPVGALWVPVVGPFIQMGHEGNSSVGNVVLVVDGLGQVAGATMLAFGLFSPRHVLVRNDLGTVRVSPVGLGGGKVGWGLTGTF